MTCNVRERKTLLKFELKSNLILLTSTTCANKKKENLLFSKMMNNDANPVLKQLLAKSEIHKNCTLANNVSQTPRLNA